MDKINDMVTLAAINIPSISISLNRITIKETKLECKSIDTLIILTK